MNRVCLYLARVSWIALMTSAGVALAAVKPPTSPTHDELSSRLAGSFDTTPLGKQQMKAKGDALKRPRSAQGIDQNRGSREVQLHQNDLDMTATEISPELPQNNPALARDPNLKTPVVPVFDSSTK
jgi:hypothetical protein